MFALLLLLSSSSVLGTEVTPVISSMPFVEWTPMSTPDGLVTPFTFRNGGQAVLSRQNLHFIGGGLKGPLAPFASHHIISVVSFDEFTLPDAPFQAATANSGGDHATGDVYVWGAYAGSTSPNSFASNPFPPQSNMWRWNIDLADWENLGALDPDMVPPFWNVIGFHAQRYDFNTDSYQFYAGGGLSSASPANNLEFSFFDVHPGRTLVEKWPALPDTPFRAVAAGASFFGEQRESLLVMYSFDQLAFSSQMPDLVRLQRYSVETQEWSELPSIANELPLQRSGRMMYPSLVTSYRGNYVLAVSGGGATDRQNELNPNELAPAPASGASRLLRLDLTEPPALTVISMLPGAPLQTQHPSLVQLVPPHLQQFEARLDATLLIGAGQNVRTPVLFTDLDTTPETPPPAETALEWGGVWRYSQGTGQPGTDDRFWLQDGTLSQLPGPSVSAYSAVIDSTSRVHYVGGAALLSADFGLDEQYEQLNGRNASSFVWTFDANAPVPQARWRHSYTLPVATVGACAAVTSQSNRLLVIGGIRRLPPLSFFATGSGDTLSTIQVCDLGLLTAVAPPAACLSSPTLTLPQASAFGACASSPVTDLVYYAEGYTEMDGQTRPLEQVARLYQIQFSGGAVVEVAQLPCARCGAYASLLAWFDGASLTLILGTAQADAYAGGYAFEGLRTSTQMMANLYELDLAQGRWRVLPASPYVMPGSAAALVPDPGSPPGDPPRWLYFFGGTPSLNPFSVPSSISSTQGAYFAAAQAPSAQYASVFDLSERVWVSHGQPWVTPSPESFSGVGGNAAGATQVFLIGGEHVVKIALLTSTGFRSGGTGARVEFLPYRNPISRPAFQSLEATSIYPPPQLPPPSATRSQMTSWKRVLPATNSFYGPVVRALSLRAHGTRLYLLGGMDASLATLGAPPDYQLSSPTEQCLWIEIDQPPPGVWQDPGCGLPFEVAAHAGSAALLEDRRYVVVYGGLRAGGQAPADRYGNSELLVLDTDTDQWLSPPSASIETLFLNNLVPPLDGQLAATLGAAAAPHGQQAVMFMGGVAASTVMGELADYALLSLQEATTGTARCFSYDVLTEQVSMRPSLPTGPIIAPTAASTADGQRIFLTGGIPIGSAASSSFSNPPGRSILSFSVPEQRWSPVPRQFLQSTAAFALGVVPPVLDSSQPFALAAYSGSGSQQFGIGTLQFLEGDSALNVEQLSNRLLPDWSTPAQAVGRYNFGAFPTSAAAAATVLEGAFGAFGAFFTDLQNTGPGRRNYVCQAGSMSVFREGGNQLYECLMYDSPLPVSPGNKTFRVVDYDDALLPASTEPPPPPPPIDNPQGSGWVKRSAPVDIYGFGVMVALPWADVIYLLGGSREGFPSTDILRYRPPPLDAWEPADFSAPVSLRRPAACAMQSTNRVYVAGGIEVDVITSAQTPNSAIYAFDADTMEESSFPSAKDSLPVAVESFQLVCLTQSGRVMAIGGISPLFQTIGQSVLLDVATAGSDAWLPTATMPVRISRHSAAADADERYVYVAFGSAQTSFQFDLSLINPYVFRYDLQLDEWIHLPTTTSYRAQTVPMTAVCNRALISPPPPALSSADVVEVITGGYATAIDLESPGFEQLVFAQANDYLTAGPSSLSVYHQATFMETRNTFFMLLDTPSFSGMHSFSVQCDGSPDPSPTTVPPPPTTAPPPPPTTAPVPTPTPTPTAKTQKDGVVLPIVVGSIIGFVMLIAMSAAFYTIRLAPSSLSMQATRPDTYFASSRRRQSVYSRDRHEWGWME